MIPKISVSPDATRNSSKPYWTAFRHWTRKVPKSTARALHPAAACRGGQALDGDAHHLVLLAVDLAQVDVLHRVVRFAHREGAARAVDLRLLDRGRELGLLRDVALGGIQPDGQDLRRVVALHGIHV